MKLGLLLAILLSPAAWGSVYPCVAFHDLPEGILGGIPGGTSVAVSLSEGTWRASIARSLTRRLDVVAFASPADLFDLEARVLVVRDLLPLNVVATIGIRRISVISTLFLGPVHVSYGRTWGDSEARWGFVQHAFHQTMTLVLGLERRDGGLGPILGLRVHPGETRLWGASLIATQSGFRLSIGGAL